MRRTLALLFLLWSFPASATVTCTLPFNLQNATTADATQVMANYNALVMCFTQSASAGVNTDITALTGLTTPLSPSQGGSNVYAGSTSTGSANAQVVAGLTPTSFSLTAGKRVTFLAGFTNTTAMTLNVNATGAVAVNRLTPSGSVALAGGEIVAGNYTEAVYDGTRFQLYTNASTPGIGGTTGLAGAATVDLGLAPNHNVFITSAATISSFGSSASTIYPVYRVSFGTGTTLVYNATSLILPGLASITTALGDIADAAYLGSGNWIVTSYYRASGTALVNPTPLSGAVGLVITNDAGTPNTEINVAVDQVVMIKPSGSVPFYSAAFSQVINCTTTGANGLDAGALGGNTWYNVFMISNGFAVAGLASLSATAPVMPAGYTYWVRLGAMRTDGSANFLRTRQQGSHAFYTTAPVQLISGSNPAWTAIAIGSVVPPTATQIKGVMSSISMGNNTTTSMAPNGGYPTTSTGNVPTTPWSITNSTGAANGLSANMVFEFNLESTNIYYASSAGSATTISAVGWTDKVNAN